MKIVIFGLSVSSSWGNGHATLWRGLISALARRGHQVVFFEKDVPYYAEKRDCWQLPGGGLRLYTDFEEAKAGMEQELRHADVAMVTSYCPDGVEASKLVLNSNAEIRAFYDLDTPVTLANLVAGQTVSYLLPDGLGGFELVLSYTGGTALTDLQTCLGAKWVEPLYGSVDPQLHFPVEPRPEYAGDCSYLGTYAADRQEALQRLFIDVAKRLPEQRFVMAGAQYPEEFPWTDNLYFVQHMPPYEHGAFYCSSRLTLNVTRAPMAEMGYCPSARFFEAAACGVPVLTDQWEGLDHFFTPGEEIIVAESTDDAIEALLMPHQELRLIAERARQRTLDEHTADHRAAELEQILNRVLAARPALSEA